MCEALGLEGYNKVYVAEQAHIKILFSTYVELHGPALFQEGSTEDPLNVMHGINVDWILEKYYARPQIISPSPLSLDRYL